MKNICILPWISLDRNADTSHPSFAPCCLYKGETEYQDFETYWNSEELKNLRNDMLEGKRPSGCWKCWHDEDNGKKSMRQSVNESRLQPHLDVTKKTAKQLKPLQVKLLAGATCNLACRMCQSHVSSRVYKVWQEIGRETTEPYRYDDVSNKLIRENADSVQYIDLMGGEPFYHKKVHDLIQFLVDKDHAKNITIYVTTNAMIINDQLIKNLKIFKEVVVIVSLDAVGKKHEYIRPGANWHTIENNIDRMRNDNLNVIIQPVVSAINILCLPELVDWCGQRKLSMTQMCLVHNPPELHPKNLPSKLKKLVDPKFQKFTQGIQTHECIDFIKKLDEYWKTNIVEIMPEWHEVYKQNTANSRFEKDYDLYRRTLEYTR